LQGNKKFISFTWYNFERFHIIKIQNQIQRLWRFSVGNPCKPEVATKRLVKLLIFRTHSSRSCIRFTSFF
jgi:hypothetical protein